MSVKATVSAAEFRAACGLFPTGVTVVTRRLEDGSPYGMTVSSFTSVSLHPALILVCIDRGARFVRHLPDHMPFAVNVLNENQQSIAARFADKKEENRFAEIEWKAGAQEAPLIAGVVANFICSLHQVVKSGDHFILIGEVHEIGRYEGWPLVWCDRGYHCLPSLRRR